MRYELYRRRAHLDGWGLPLTSVSATGAAQYARDDGPYAELVRYDFGVRAVDTAGRYSAMTVAANVSVTAGPPVPPGPEDWFLEPREGAIALWLLNDSPGAQYLQGPRAAGKYRLAFGRDGGARDRPGKPVSLFSG